MMVEKKTRVRKVKYPRIYVEHKDVNLYLQVARSVWESAMDLPPTMANAKKKEAVGWAILAARTIAEEEINRGKTLMECLQVAAQVLMDKSEEIRENV